MRSIASDPTVRAIVEGASLTVDVGCDLLTDDGWQDISDDLVPGGSQVEHGSYRTIHRTCKVTLARRLDWGKDRIRLRMALTAAAGTVESSLGVFVLSTPETVAGETPRRYDVEGYDLLELLDHAHGETFVAAAGTGYLANARTLAESAGLVVEFADEQSDRLIGTAKVWPIDEQTTTLNIVNELLAAVGFRGLSVDHEGIARSQPYDPPSDRGAEWVYDATSADTTVGVERVATFDFFDAPNVFVGLPNDPDSDLVPAHRSNPSDGPTSVDARGREIPMVMRFDAADQAALESQTDEAFQNLSAVADEFAVTVGPNPLHGHLDVVQLIDRDLAVDRKCVVRSWTLPMDGSDMQLDMRGV